MTTIQFKVLQALTGIMMGFAFISVMWTIYILMEAAFPIEVWNSYPEPLQSGMALILSGVFWLLFSIVRDASDAKNNPEKTDG